nr:PREDICTED: limb region 1 homolog-like protein [Lepisosteus oculatus]
MVSSVVGFYSSPLFTGLLPRTQDTTLTQIIGNCVALLVLSSALPVFSRTLGITRFDLLGDFGRYNWLGNFHIVFLYNMAFAGLTSACLMNKVSRAVRNELLRAFGQSALCVSACPRLLCVRRPGCVCVSCPGLSVECVDALEARTRDGMERRGRVNWRGSAQEGGSAGGQYLRPNGRDSAASSAGGPRPGQQRVLICAAEREMGN